VTRTIGLRPGGIGALALAVAGVIALNGCGAGGDRSELQTEKERIGITSDTVTVGTHAPLTGVVSPGYREIPAGAQAYFDYVNAHGGVNGRKIEFLVRDDAYNPTTTSQVIQELVLKDEVFAIVGGFGTPTHRAAVDYLNEQGVPDLFPVSGSLFWGDPETYPETWAWQPDYEIEGKLLGQWVKENHPGAKVGLFLQDDDLGDGGESGLRRYLDDQIVSVQRYSPSNTNVSPQMAALKAAGAEVVVAFDTPAFTALSQLAALKINYDPQWVITRVGSNPDLVGPLLSKFSDGSTATDVLDGLVTTGYMPEPSTQDNDWSALWRKVWAEHGNRAELDSFRVTGMAIAYTFVQALAQAGDDPTRSGIEQALAQMGGPGLINPAFTAYRWAEDNHRGMTGARILQVEGGTISKELTPTLVTGNGDTPIEEDSSGDSEDSPPASGIPNAD
jgi:branched-chain amino acid transport system substrate-binding protein